MKVTNYYDIHLQRITNCAREDIEISEGMRFGAYLLFFFQTYPRIRKCYPPGILGFTLNKTKPTEFDIVENNAEVHFEVILGLNGSFGESN